MKKFSLFLVAIILLISMLILTCCQNTMVYIGPTPTETTSHNTTTTTTTQKSTTTSNKVTTLPVSSSTSTTSDVGNTTPAEDVILRMATGYNNLDTGLFFSDANLFKGADSITLADGKTYRVGDLKPTWVEVGNRLGIDFEDRWIGAGSAEKEFAVWEKKLGEVDMISGSAAKLNEAGVAGKLVNIADYLDRMPNFKAFLEANPIVRLSITGDTSTGAIYFSPYFDGVNDIERMPLMRTDWVEILLNGEGEFTAAASNTLATAVYTPYMPTSGKVVVDAVSADGKSVISLTKDYDKAGNIIATMNAAGTLTGVEAVNMLRKYIDEAYNGYYGTNRADLFIGQDAAWDADELVALLRCVVANPQTLNGTDNVEGLFSREDYNNQRRVDMFRFAGTLFGVRGLDSRQDYLYVGADGLLHDARQEEDTYIALERMNAMVQEGLIADSFINGQNNYNTAYMLENDIGFMHYDYNQTQTYYNHTKLQDGEKYMAVMIPVARWNDGTGDMYMRFTESWRSVKTNGWAISLEGIAGDEAKLLKALELIDYMYSKEGQILMSYGPDEFIKTNLDGSYVTFNFNGEYWPVVADATYEEIWAKAGGNYINYARKYLGSAIGFVKSQAFEYQCTDIVGQEGAGKISNAITLGIIKHPELSITENPWWTSVPTLLPITKAENSVISSYAELDSKGRFSFSKNYENLFIDIIRYGYDGTDAHNRQYILNTVKNTWHGSNCIEIKNDAWLRLLQCYNNYQ